MDPKLPTDNYLPVSNAAFSFFPNYVTYTHNVLYRAGSKLNDHAST